MQVHEYETETLSQSRAALAAALKKLTDLTAENEANKTRLAEAEKEHASILASASPDEEQFEALRKAGDIVQILRSRSEQIPVKIEAAKGALRQASEAGLKAFQDDLNWLVEARQTAAMDKLKAMIDDAAQWPWAEEIAKTFIRHTPGLKALNELEARVSGLSRSVGSQYGAEQFLAAISLLEAEAAR
jgi:hypothetical protein